MKNNRSHIGVFLTAILLLVSVFSCDKELNKTDPNRLTLDAYFKTASELEKATNAVYANFHAPWIMGREWFFVHDTRSDEVASGGSQLEQPRAQMLAGTHDPSNAIMGWFWQALYTMIHRANTVIENGPNVTDNISLRDRCVAQAKFFRAWGYFELVSQWGPVPLYTATVKTPDAFQPRAKEDDIYALIVSDLTAAATVLPGRSGTEKGRVTAAAANVLLGRVLMQKGDYAGAKTALLKVPTSGPDGYRLRDRYLDNFEAGLPTPSGTAKLDESLEFNDESIFEAVFFDKGNNDFNWGSQISGDGATANQSTVRNQEYCPVAWRNLIPSNKYLDEFEKTTTGAVKTDPRYKFSVYECTSRAGVPGDLYNNGQSILDSTDVQGPQSVVKNATATVTDDTIKVSWRKFMLLYREDKGVAGFHPSGNNQRLMRYAEVLLMLAECENELGNLAPAIAYLNQVRARPSVAMPPYPTPQFLCANKNQVTRAIMHERTVELGDEELKNIDIMRWRKKGYYPLIMPEPLSYFVANKHELLPIPQSEIDNNPKLGSGGINKQNPGY